MIKIIGLSNLEIQTYAEAVLENPVFHAVINEFRATAIDRWANSEPADVALREKIWSEFRAADQLFSRFGDLIVEAKAEARIAEEDNAS